MRQLTERQEAIREDLKECESLGELKAMWCHWNAEYPECVDDPQLVLWVKSTLCRLRMQAVPAVEEMVVEEPKVSEIEQLQQLLSQLEQLKSAKPKPPVIVATGRRYELLKTDVSWSTKPQVHAVMHILSAHLKPGDVVDEADIVRMMEANREVLETKQEAKRIWDYYKGNSNEGLMAHGNIRRV